MSLRMSFNIYLLSGNYERSTRATTSMVITAAALWTTSSQETTRGSATLSGEPALVACSPAHSMRQYHSTDSASGYLSRESSTAKAGAYFSRDSSVAKANDCLSSG